MIRTTTLLFLAAFTSTPVLADVTFFDWTTSSSTTGSAIAEGITASYNLQPQVTLRNGNGATNPSFINAYGSGRLPRFLLSGSGSTSGTVSFSSPLRPGSVMLVFDLDSSESIAFQSNSPISYLGQIETRLGENSSSPSWNAGTQNLAGPSSLNLEPAAILDISGVSSISFTYTRQAPTEASLGFAVTPVPEPSGLAMLSSLMLLGTLNRRRRVA